MEKSLPAEWSFLLPIRRKKAITAIGRRKAAIGAVTVEAGAAEAAGRAAADMKNVRHAKNIVPQDVTPNRTKVEIEDDDKPLYSKIEID